MSYKMFDNLPHFPYNTPMNTKTLTFTQDNTKRISIIITNQDADEVVLSPAENKEGKRRFTVRDLEKGFFHGGKNLSKNIDKIVYGI
jgi:hypothetical protein